MYFASALYSPLAQELTGGAHPTTLVSDVHKLSWIDRKQLRCSLMVTDDWSDILSVDVSLHVAFFGKGNPPLTRVPIIVHYYIDSSEVLCS